MSQVKLKNAIVGEYGMVGNRAELEVNGMDIYVKTPLPETIRQQVEKFYIEEYLKIIGASNAPAA